MKFRKIVILVFLIFVEQCFCADLGQRFILTLPTFEKDSDYKDWLGRTRPGGVMLMPTHLKNRQKTKKLCELLQSESKNLKIYPLLIAVDWEGGIVSRANEMGGFVSVPSPFSLAKAGRSCCFLAGKLIGQQLRSVGINVDFAPSMDLFDSKNQILGSRCFSSDEKKVAQYGVAFCKGLESEGVIPVIKHYPGLGLGNKDTHLDSVNIDANLFDFEKNTFPFDFGLKNNLPAIMVSHAKYSQFGNKPASMSSPVINKLKKENSDVLVLTDDIFMEAFAGTQDLKISALESIKNGFDMLIYSAPAEKQIEFVEKLNALIDKKDEKKLEKQYLSIKKFKKKQIINSEITQDFLLSEKRVGSYLAKRVFTDPIKHINQSSKIFLISIDLPKIRLAESWFLDKNLRKEFAPKYFVQPLNAYSTALNDLFLKYNYFCKEFIFNPLEKSFNKVTEFLNEGFDKNSIIVLQSFFYGGGAWNGIQKELLEKLKPFEDKITIFSLGHPYEKNILPNANILSLGSFHFPIIKQAFKKFVSKDLKTGAQKLVENTPTYLANKKIGLLCHKASIIQVNGETKFLPDYLFDWCNKRQDKKTKLKAIFAPEHGIWGQKEAFGFVSSEKKSKWNCPIYSLHGDVRAPTKKMLAGLDLLIVDLQEVGVRCYTYLSTLLLTMQVAKENNVEVLVLDRPNPIDFWGSQGPTLEKAYESFLGKVYTPFLHGKSIGTLAKELNNDICAKLTVLNYENEKRVKDDYFFSKFIPPSPNLVSIDSVYSYPMTVFVEGTNYSEGRGTIYPFQQIGAPWVDGEVLAKNLNSKKLPGIFFEATNFIPKKIIGMDENPKHKNEHCSGVFLHIYDKKAVDPMRTAEIVLKELFKFYPKKSDLIIYSDSRYALDARYGNSELREKLLTINLFQKEK